jgi:type VI protein secretion system component Hcp
MRWFFLPVTLCAAQSVFGDGLFVRFSEFPSGIPFVSGDSTSSGRTGWSQIESFQGGAFRSVSLIIGGSRESSRVQISGVSLSKQFDRLSPALFDAATRGGDFGKVEIDSEVFDGTSLVSPFSITLNDVLLDGCSWSFEGDSLFESISFFFNSASYQILKKNPDGTYTEGNGFLAYYDQVTGTGTYGSIGAVSPAIPGVAAQTAVRNSTGNSFSFSFTDPDTSVGSLIADASSLTEGLIPDASIVVTGSGGTRTVTFAAANATGTATIRLSVSDGDNVSSRDVTVYVINSSGTPTLNGPTVLLGCIEGLSPFREIVIAGPDIGSGLQLVLSVDYGTLTLATDIPGGVGPGEISGNGSNTVTILSSMDQINATLADPFGLRFSTLTNADVELTIILNDTDPGNSLLDALVIPVVVYEDLFSCLQAEYFTEAEIAGNLKTGELDDYDGDGTLNLIEIATGLDPTNPGELVPMTIAISEAGGDRFLNVNYHRRTGASTFVYSLELYDTVTARWLDGTAEVTALGAPESINPQIESVTFRVTDPLIGPATLVRLKVEKLP